MKLRRDNVQVLLKKVLAKDTPALDLEQRKILLIELKRLGLPPKISKDKVIVPG